MQQIKNFNLFLKLLPKWPIESKIIALNLMLNHQNVRSVKWDSLEKQRHEFVEYIKKLLPVSYQQGLKIFDEVPALRSNYQMVLMKPNIDLLLKNKISVETIIENPFLLLMKRGKYALCSVRKRTSVALQFIKISLIYAEVIEEKLQIIEEMYPKDVNDFSPLLELKLPVLKQIANQAKVERNFVPAGNRIYFFSKNLKVSDNSLEMDITKQED